MTKEFIVFLSTAHRDKDDEKAHTGDVDYARKISQLVANTKECTCEYITQIFDENHIYDYIKQKTPNGQTPILHIMLNNKRTGGAFTPDGLARFKKEQNGKVVITVLEAAKDNVRSFIPEMLNYFKYADELIFLDAADKEAVKKHSEAENSQLKKIIAESQVIRVPATVELSRKKFNERGNNILSFGMIRAGKGYGYLLELAKQLKNSTDTSDKDRRIIIVGSVQKHIKPDELKRLMAEIYTTKKEEIENKCKDTDYRTQNEQLIFLLDKYKKEKIEMSLPIDLYLDVPEEQLPEICDECSYAVQPQYRGATLRNSSINSLLSNEFIVYSCDYITTDIEDCLCPGGKYFGAIKTFKTNLRDNGNSAQFANDVLNNIKEREQFPELNKETLEKVRKVFAEELEPSKIAAKHVSIYNSVTSNSEENVYDICCQAIIDRLNSSGILMKTIRSDKYCYLSDYLQMIIKIIPEPRYNMDIRNWNNDFVNGKGDFKAIIKEGEYRTTPYRTNDEQQNYIQPKDKAKRSKPNSHTFVNSSLTVPLFGWNRKHRDSYIVGFCFNPDDTVISQIMPYDGGTIGRPWAGTRKQAEMYSTSHNLYLTLDKLDEAIKTDIIAKYNINEVIARTRFHRPSSKEKPGLTH